MLLVLSKNGKVEVIKFYYFTPLDCQCNLEKCIGHVSACKCVAQCSPAFALRSLSEKSSNFKLKASIRAKTLMQKMSNGSVIFIFNNKFYQFYSDDGCFII